MTVIGSIDLCLPGNDEMSVCGFAYKIFACRSAKVVSRSEKQIIVGTVDTVGLRETFNWKGFRRCGGDRYIVSTTIHYQVNFLVQNQPMQLLRSPQ